MTHYCQVTGHDAMYANLPVYLYTAGGLNATCNQTEQREHKPCMVEYDVFRGGQSTSTRVTTDDEKRIYLKDGPAKAGYPFLRVYIWGEGFLTEVDL